MTAVIHHGAPGSYKTFSLVQRVMIPALLEGRVVITNVRGFDDLNKIQSALGCDIPASAQIFYLEPNDQGFEAMARFFHWAPAGALIVMDEGQRVYPTRNKRFDELDQPNDIVICDVDNNPLFNVKTGEVICRPSTVENAFDQHRHFNWDIYISTPNIGKIHSEIRKTVEWGYRHRDNSGLLPWFKNTWTEFRHDSEQSGKSVSHYSGTPKRYKADFKIFECYQSTATGTAKTSNENISIFRDPKLRLVLGVLLVALIMVGYQLSEAYERITAKHAAADALHNPVDSKVSGPGNPVSNRDDSGQFDHKVAFPLHVAVNPFAGLQIYFVGSVNDIDLFEVVLADGRIVHLTTIELRNLGYVTSVRAGTYVAFDLNGETIYAFSKPPAPVEGHALKFNNGPAQFGALANN